MSRFHRLIPAVSLLALIAGSGCSMIKDMNEMRDSTADLDKKTTAMAGNTATLNQNTDFTYHDLRQGNSVTIRTDQIRALDQNPQQEDKIAIAGVYFMSFEYQLWKNTGDDTIERWEILKDKAAQEFFLTVAKYLPKDASDYNPSPSETDEKSKDLYAFAIALDQINPNIEALAAHDGFTVPSMLDLIQEALAMKERIDTGVISFSDEPPYVHEILDNEAVAVYLLRLRANFFPAMTLAKISHIGNGSIFTAIKMLLTNWTSQVSSLNLDQIREKADWMTKANATRDFLESVPSPRAPYGAKLDGRLIKVFRHMKAFDAPMPGAPEATVDEASAARAEMRAKSAGDLAAEIDQFRR